jgi:uncharacterized protein (TIGR02147 family)
MVDSKDVTTTEGTAEMLSPAPHEFLEPALDVPPHPDVASIRKSKTNDTPVVFDFIDYRLFLHASYEQRRATNPHWSMSAFSRKAGFGESSRGYLKLIMDGKRNLSPKTIARLAQALSLDRKESLFFENLVHYNQARTQGDRSYYFSRLDEMLGAKKPTSFQLLRNQVQYLSKWYYISIRELVALDSFVEDTQWIASNLRAKVTHSQIQEAIEDLLAMGLLTRDTSGKLLQAQAIVRAPTEGVVELIDLTQIEVMKMAFDSIENDPRDARDMSSVTISCPASQFENLRKEINRFRDHLVTTYGNYTKGIDAVFQMNFQLFSITPPKRNKKDL